VHPAKMNIMSERTDIITKNLFIRLMADKSFLFNSKTY
jgi:hypothetical protein